MMTRTLLVRCAPIAIAAAAALPGIPAFAQDTVTTEPVIVLPEVAPTTVPTTPAPTIILPETTAQPASPVSAATADPVEAAPVATRTPARTVAARQGAAPRAVAPVATADAPVAAPIPAATVAATATLPVDAAPIATKAAPVATNRDATGELAFAGLLGALGLAAVGGVAYAASRRRRRNAVEADQYEGVAYEQPFEEPTAAPVPVTPRAVEPTPDPVFTAPTAAASAFASASAKRPAPRANGDPITLPAEVPETFEERDALLKELVAAEPDKANPFTSPRARARRAKLIMQSLGRSFQSRKPRIDLSEYTNRWPALRGWQPATA